jgi:RNA polymerase sigma-70 factor (ECF subfamily)
MEDREIIRKVIDRDEAALTEIDRKYGAYMKSIARGILNDERDVEECVSDASMNAWNRLPEADPDNLKAYLGMLVRTAAISHKRANNAAKRGGGNESTPFDELEELVGEGDVAEAADQALLAKLISNFLRERPAEERIIFVRRYWYGDSIEQIAAAFDAGQSKIKMMLKRTRDRLRKVLKKEGYIQ